MKAVYCCCGYTLSGLGRVNGCGYARQERKMFPAVCGQGGKSTRVPF